MGSFYDLIFDMVEKEILSWPDIKKLRGLGRNLLWLALASTPTQDLVEWKRHLQKPFPWRKYLMFHHGDSVDKVGTQLCIIEDGLFWGARRYFGNQNLLHGITRIYGEVWPECRRFLPLTLMSVGNALLDAETAQKEAFAGIARILSSIDSAQVDAGWLSGTREWTVRWREAPDDLLLTYSSGLEEVYREGYVDTDRYTAARQFVDGLIDKRKYLLAREGPKMG